MSNLFCINNLRKYSEICIKSVNYIQREGFRRFLNKVYQQWTTLNRTGVTHLYPNDCYYGHLSIYLFATQFTQGCRILDAGSGMGYGSAYLAKKGALHVEGIELNGQSVKLSRNHFRLPNLVYHQMDLQNIEGFGHHQFDVIFSSNVMEHILDVSAFLRSTWELLKSDGIFIVAVPPITSTIDRMANISIVDHLNIWSPRQWHHVLSQYLTEIECYSHALAKPGVTLKLDNTPEETKITEKDFSFRKVEIDDFEYKTTSLTAIFVARKPVPKEKVPPPGRHTTFIDDSFSRSLDNQVIEIREGATLTDITSSTHTNLGPLFADNRYCQAFIAKNNNLIAISLNVATYCRQINSVARLLILNDEGSEVIREKEMDTTGFIDNTWQTFFFKPISDSKGKRYIFCIETNGNDEAITLWTNNTIKGICKKNGSSLNHAICFRTYYHELPVNSIAPFISM
jgi:2-polyprenyl-3-methyl-5-hydroxy-6-metoxy-1,4-benzoquinol methylase